MTRLCIVVLAVGVFQAAFAEIPSYIHLCKRSDPKIEQCIINSIEELRPQLAKGIPELEVPALEPLLIPEIAVSRGGPFRAVGTNVLVRGASKFEIKDLKADIDKMEFVASISIPFLTFDATYDVNAKVLGLNLKGKGPLKANTTDVDGIGILKGHKMTRDGKNYLMLDTLDLKLKMKNYNIQLENLFNGDKALGDAVNIAINENKKELLGGIRPIAEKTVSGVLLDIANKITQHFPYEELFPQ